jgi:hypothetical protein
VAEENKFDNLISAYCDDLNKINEGLDPEILAYWYKRIEDKVKEMCDKELSDKIVFAQNRYLWMKFDLRISKRAVPLVLQTIRDYIPLMPFSTVLYFEKVYQIIMEEFNKDLI